MQNSPFRLPVAALTILALGLAQTGCVTKKKYRLAKADTPAAQTLEWSVLGSPAKLSLETVIIIKGPGSWKREARWDEYVVRISNQGQKPLAVESAELVDVLGNPQIPGADPWALEKLSYTNWDRYGKTGLQLLAGAGTVALGAVTAVSIGTIIGGSAGSAAGLLAAMTIIPVAGLVDIGVVAAMNHNNKKKIVAEFDRRRLKFPLTIAPGQTLSGSLFFPMTPGPQRLIVKGRVEEATLELSLDLKLLAGLHLKSVDTSASPL